MRLAQFYKYHGINIKTCYADFDKHHIGVVTESQVGTNNYQFVDPALKIQNPLTVSFFLLQFYRSFPGSPDVTAEETVLLAKKYRDHTRPGLCNYYSFHEDIERKQNGKNMDLFSNFTFTALLILLSCQPGWEGVYSLSYNWPPSDFVTNIYGESWDSSSNRSLILCVQWDACHELLIASLEIFMPQGHRTQR